MITRIVWLLLLWSTSEAANVLYVIPFTSTSHYKLLRPIGLEMARRGHNVTVITAHREPNPPNNYHQVMADDIKIWEEFEGGKPNVFDMVNLSMEEFHEKVLWNGGLSTTKNALNSKEVKDFLAKDNQFDLVIVELFYQESLTMLSHIYKAPLALITTYGNCMRSNFLMRNPMQLATVIHEFSPVYKPRSFTGRLANFYYSMYDLYVYYTWYLPKQEEIVTKYMKNVPNPRPSLADIHRNASLVLMNSHFSMDSPAAYLPNVVEIGGIHIEEFDKKLPNDLQKFLDNAPHGVVYVNFGSNVRSSELPAHKRDAFINVFRNLKQKVLWKWEDKELPNKPDNVEIRNWMPQKEILAHPNVLVFIAHGGLIGLQEATYHGVPVLGVPIYADQYNNLLQAQEEGYGRILEYHDINEKTLADTLNEMLKDREYQNKAKEISKRFWDRPMSALDTSAFWLEYVIRHKGAKFMRNPALDMSWISYAMLDVYGFLIVVITLCVYVTYKIGKFIIGYGTSLDKVKKL